jgi:hypothetical protein
MTRFALRALPVALLVLSASIVRADDIPNNTVRIGEYWVFYHTTRITCRAGSCRRT